MSNVADQEVLEAAMLASAQAVEHYEITRYETLEAWAKQLGRSDCASVLHQTLEERRTDKKQLCHISSKLSDKALAVFAFALYHQSRAAAA